MSAGKRARTGLIGKIEAEVGITITISLSQSIGPGSERIVVEELQASSIEVDICIWVDLQLDAGAANRCLRDVIDSTAEASFVAGEAEVGRCYRASGIQPRIQYKCQIKG